MKMQVFHCPERLFRDACFLGTAVEVCAFVNNYSSKYIHVADVEVSDTADIYWSLEEAYEKTNSIHQCWNLNEGVTAIRWPCRSTSKGDFVVSPTGGVYAVASIGFVRLPTTPKVP